MIFTDQLGKKIELAETPKRIISLVPSQTELLSDLGLHDEVVGITKFCIHPEEWYRNKVRVGGTKKYDFEKIKQLNPDLIIGNKEENEQEQINELSKLYNVWMSDIYNLKDALNMIACFGAMLDKNEKATNIKLQIESNKYNHCVITKPRHRGNRSLPSNGSTTQSPDDIMSPKNVLVRRLQLRSLKTSPSMTTV